MSENQLYEIFSRNVEKQSLLYNYYYVKELFVLLIILYLITKNHLFILFIGFLLFFYRSSPNVSKNKHYFLSPSNSKIDNITKENNNIVITTYLSPLDKHYMIAPYKSKIIDITRKINIKYADCLSITFETYINEKRYTYILEQIVNHIGNWGYIPSVIYKHRCITFMKEGDNIEQGEKYGLIRFGSCMKYIIPRELIDNYKYLKKDKYFDIGDKLFRINM